MRAEIAVFVLNLLDVIFLRMAPHRDERSCPRGVMAFHSVSVNWTHNLPIVRRTLYHLAIVAPAQSSSPMPRFQVML